MIPLAAAAPVVAAVGAAAVAGVVGWWAWAWRNSSKGASVPTTKQPPPVSSMSALQPRFRSVLELVIQDLRKQGFQPKVYETVRSAERQRWLFENTSSTRTARLGKHGEGLAADLIDGRPHPNQARRPGAIIGWGSWADEPDAGPGDEEARMMADQFYDALGRAAVARGLVWGGNWRSIVDKPHVEWASSAAGVA